MHCINDIDNHTPKDEREKAIYELALTHVQYAKEQGKSEEEIKAIFKDVMEGKVTTCPVTSGREVPTDKEALARYESAIRHAQKAKAEGKTIEEVKAIFEKVVDGNGTCSSKK